MRLLETSTAHPVVQIDEKEDTAATSSEIIIVSNRPLSYNPQNQERLSQHCHKDVWQMKRARPLPRLFRPQPRFLLCDAWNGT
eukprot:IDg8195t1